MAKPKADKPTYKYTLTKDYQSPTDGKVINTDINIEDYADVDKFFKALVKAKVITKEESEELTSVYYVI